MYRNILKIVVIAALLLTSACSDHSHDQEDEGHGHEHGGGISVTQWNNKTEIFMEYPALVSGSEAAFAIHLSKMSDFKPVTEGSLTCIFTKEGQTKLTVTENAPSHPGIFRPVITAPEAGLYQMELRLNSGGLRDTIIVADVKVYANESALPHVEEEADGQSISYLKEQQWKIDFRTDPVQHRTLVSSVHAVGEIQPKTQWHAEVPAPANGLILADQNDIIPSVGKWVNKGSILAVISPPANSDYSLNHIQSEYLLAQSEYERAKRLYEKQAIPQKRLEEARLKFEAKKAGYDVIARQIDFGNPGNDKDISSPHYHLIAPIDGYIEEIFFHIGESVQAGKPLFKITNPARLLLKANVPAARIGQINAISDASFLVEGYSREFVISRLNGKLISVGNIISETSRTVPVYFEFNNPDNLLKIGMFAEVSLKTGQPESALAIPKAAIFDEDGIAVAYVHTEGESFEKRILKTGITDRGYTQIFSGISEGERVVTVGGYQVRLASMSTSVPTGHGHAH